MSIPAAMRIPAILLALFFVSLGTPRPALAATTYTLSPAGPLPAGCSSSSATSYACPSLTLAWADSIVVPNANTTLAIAGAFQFNGNSINWSSPASGFSLTAASVQGNTHLDFNGNITATGTLDLSSSRNIVGNLAAGGNALIGKSVTGTLTASGNVTCNWATAIGGLVTGASIVSGGSSTYGAGLRATNGGVTLGSNDTVNGNVSATASTAANAKLVMASGDTINGNVVIAGPATVSGTINGTLTAGQNTTTQWASRITGNVTTTNFVSGGGGTYGGAIAATNGGVTLGSSDTVNGNVSAAASTAANAKLVMASGDTINGNVVIAGPATVSGTINGTLTAGQNTTTEWNSRITGNVTTTQFISGGGSTYGGSITATSGKITLGTNDQLTGDATATSDITLGSSARARGNVTSGRTVTLSSSDATVDQCVTAPNGSNTITLGWHAHVGGYCCKAGPNCQTSCLNNGSGYAVPPRCTATPTLSIDSVSVTEGNSGTATATFTVTLSAASSQTVTVNYATANGTASAGSDYTATSGTLSFSPGQTSKSIAVPVSGDTLFEADETFTVTLASPTNATLGTAVGTGTIRNDDTAPTLSLAAAAANEGDSGSANMSFTVTLSAASGLAVSASYATTAGTATAGTSCAAGVDYLTTSGTVAMAAGATTAVITVPVCGDTVYEADETFTLTLAAPTNATLGTGTATGSIVNDDPPQLLGDWRMDETAWSGAANEVQDSSGNGNHGTAKIANGTTPLPTAITGAPAYTSGSQSTCNYGQFDSTAGTVRTYTHVELSNLPALPSSFTFAAWIRSTNASAQHQRILVRDDADNGWGLSLADGTGQAKLRFFNRNITNSGTVSGQGSNPGCGVFCLDTNAVLTSNNWHYVAATIDTTAKNVTLYVYSASGTLLAKTSSAFSGTWADGTGKAAIGGETAASSEGRQASWHFLGNIDEMQIYGGVLTQPTIESLLPRVRACPTTGPHHLRIEHDGAGATCGAESFTLKACANAACSTLYTGGGITGTLQPSDTAFSIGVSGTVSVTATPTGAGTTVLSVASVTPTPANVADCLNTATGATSCDMVVSACPGGANFDCLETAITPYAAGTARLYTKLAGTALAFDVVVLKADGTVETGYVAPGGSAKSVTVELGAAADAACTGWTALSPASSQTLSFAATDLGRKTVAATTVAKAYPALRCRVTDTATGKVGCSRDAFAVRPTAPILLASPAMATPPSASATPTLAAGAAFTLTATTASGDGYAGTLAQDTGKLTAQITSQDSTAQSGGTVGTLAPAAFTANADGDENNDGIGDASYGEVGYLYLAAGAYRDTGFTAVDQPDDCVSDTTGNAHLSDTFVGGKVGCVVGNTAAVSLGRFVPAHFTLTASSLTPGNGTFSYLSQPFGVTATIEARNAGNVKTANYTGVFARGVVTFSAENANNGIDLAARLNGLTASWSAGTYGVNTTAAQLLRTAAPDGPYDALVLGVKVADADGPVLQGRDTNPTTTDADCTVSANCTHKAIGTGMAKFRFGRLRLVNYYGSELLPPRVEYRAEYWDGSRWATNKLDQTTPIGGGANLAVGGLTFNALEPFANGVGFILFNAAATGSYDIAVNLNATGSDTSCNAAHGGTAANKPWLQGYWAAKAKCNNIDPWRQDPNARVRLGSPRAPYLYLRERY